ncbi:neutrophil collagenase-like [Pholidichthys leucotaenia]
MIPPRKDSVDRTGRRKGPSQNSREEDLNRALHLLDQALGQSNWWETSVNLVEAREVLCAPALLKHPELAELRSRIAQISDELIRTGPSLCSVQLGSGPLTPTPASSASPPAFPITPTPSVTSFPSATMEDVLEQEERRHTVLSQTDILLEHKPWLTPEVLFPACEDQPPSKGPVGKRASRKHHSTHHPGTSLEVPPRVSATTVPPSLSASAAAASAAARQEVSVPQPFIPAAHTSVHGPTSPVFTPAVLVFISATLMPPPTVASQTASSAASPASPETVFASPVAESLLISRRTGIKEYLQRFYGYRPKSERQKRTADPDEDADWSTELCDKVKEMQNFFGLPPSGEITEETLAVMKKPRCGLSDVEPFGETIRWKKTTLSYRTSANKLPIPALKLHKVFKAAWKLWSNVTPMKFRKRNRREADIVISFHIGDHKDGSPFDGRGGILAHAFLPGSGIGGDVHFDADENWSFNFTGFSLLAVAVHEFGHALGLPHSSDPGSVMYPAYSFSPSSEPQLSFHDVKDVQHIYGVSANFALLVSKSPPPRTPDKCDVDLSFDAVTELQQEVLFFKGRFMWRKHPYFDEIGITLIRSLWPDTVPHYLDAVYQNIGSGAMLFFKGHQYWMMRDVKLEEGFPRNISRLGFPSRIKSIDAALHFRNDRYTVFFTGQECWRYNEQQEMMEESAMLIEQQWPGIPSPVDAAVFYDAACRNSS